MTASAFTPKRPSTSPETFAADRSHHRRRWLVRFFMVAMTLMIIIETSPRRYAFTIPAKNIVMPLSMRLGLSQGEWPLFAPDPVLNNAWLSADIYTPTGELRMWNSNYWATISGFQKFRQFRMLNLGNKIVGAPQIARDDFADFIARQQISRTARVLPKEDIQNPAYVPTMWRLNLSRNQLRMVLPEDGSLPSRDDTVWISSSVNLAIREYLP